MLIRIINGRHRQCVLHISNWAMLGEKVSAIHGNTRYKDENKLLNQHEICDLIYQAWHVYHTYASRRFLFSATTLAVAAAASPAGLVAVPAGLAGVAANAVYTAIRSWKRKHAVKKLTSVDHSAQMAERDHWIYIHCFSPSTGIKQGRILNCNRSSRTREKVNFDLDSSGGCITYDDQCGNASFTAIDSGLVVRLDNEEIVIPFTALNNRVVIDVVRYHSGSYEVVYSPITCHVRGGSALIYPQNVLSGEVVYPVQMQGVKLAGGFIDSRFITRNQGVFINPIRSNQESGEALCFLTDRRYFKKAYTQHNIFVKKNGAFQSRISPQLDDLMQLEVSDQQLNLDWERGVSLRAFIRSEGTALFFEPLATYMKNSMVDTDSSGRVEHLMERAKNFSQSMNCPRRVKDVYVLSKVFFHQGILACFMKLCPKYTFINQFMINQAYLFILDFTSRNTVEVSIFYTVPAEVAVVEIFAPRIKPFYVLEMKLKISLAVEEIAGLYTAGIVGELANLEINFEMVAYRDKNNRFMVSDAMAGGTLTPRVQTPTRASRKSSSVAGAFPSNCVNSFIDAPQDGQKI